MTNIEEKFEQEIERYKNSRLKSFRVILTVISQEALVVSLIGYLGLMLFDVLSGGIISYLFNINYFLIIIMAFFFIHSLLSLLDKS